MKVVITGASGLIGSALVRTLTGEGHEVVTLVRRSPSTPTERRWDPVRRELEPQHLAGADAVVHLAGAGVGDHRWSDEWKRTVRDSRIDGTAAVANAIVALPEAHRPRVLVSGSAVGFYGDTGDDAVDEAGRRGQGFLAELVEDWEATAAPAAEAGVRVVHPRTGVVLASNGGALGKVLPLFKLGLGGRLGSGKQWMSWISLPDQIAALRFLIDRDDLSGPVNITAPEPVRNRDYTKAIGRIVHRPTLAVVPPPALRAALGGFADEGVLVSQRVLPGRLDDAGFAFTHADIDSALRAVL